MPVVKRLTTGLALTALLIGRVQGEARRLKKASPSRAEQVATCFQRPVEEVLDLRQQGFGYGEIVKILVIAQESRRPLKELLARNAEGYGWGTICRQTGLNTVNVAKRVEKTRWDLKIRVRPVPHVKKNPLEERITP